MSKISRLMIIGGGNGPKFARFLASDNEIYIVCPVTDNGGASGKAITVFGRAIQSDLVNNLLNLSGRKADPIVKKLLSYRFPNGTTYGTMRLSQLITEALMDINYGSMDVTIRQLHESLDVFPHRVLPVTYTQGIELCAKINGEIIVRGETYIDRATHIESEDDRITQLWIEGNPDINPEIQVLGRIVDKVIFAPGSMHSSKLAVMCVPGMVSVIDSLPTSVPIIYIVNLTTTWGDTHGFGAAQEVELMNSFLGERKITHVIINDDLDIPTWVIRKYHEQGGGLTVDNFTGDEPYEVIRADVYSRKIHEQPANDATPRSALLHDGELLAPVILKI